MRVTVFAGLLMVACLSTTSVAAQGAKEIGRIKSVAAPANVLRGAQKLDAAAGTPLFVSDKLVTGPGGRVGITFADNTRFAIGPNSTVALSQFDFDTTTHKGSSLTTIDRGSLAVVSGQIAKENKDAMRVRTPTSLLAARGTRFVVEGRCFIGDGCKTASRSTVTLLSDEGAATTGKVAVLDAKTETERGQISAADTVAALGGRQVKAREVKKIRYGNVPKWVPAQPQHYVLYFYEDSTDLTEESKPILDALKKVVTTDSDIEITGHTDSTGKPEYNDELSVKRAASVKTELAKEGFPVAGARISGRGEREPLVATADDTDEPANRRVEIILR